ncbi:hypothetical protein PBI_BIGNUZ_54 [Mycobacterium phage BigNuz]|uniref:Uncharacterized protein n=1 Tax=Mycobacterium phage BigNuz TaxID=1074309 RepID=G1JX69_9CAUD|nr:hypothetical protein PBI_BIGNUZ_54 [Mycobacterium phage BigNuz]AEL98217.1 hypothetical protein PBI_BIGNUZ_54 [Mycobacterium phage BigNuz]
MNATEDGFAPLGEAPELGEPRYPMSAEVTCYRARCTKCGYIETDYGEFGAMHDEGSAIDHVLDAYDWRGRTEETGELVELRPGRFVQRRQLVELICPNCQRCEVCGTAKAYPIDEHLVCEQHEGHDFGASA